jgi:hypothetical protein
MGIRNLHIPLTGKFIPSPTKQIKFTGDGKTIALNRKQRRAMKIYNKDLIPE